MEDGIRQQLIKPVGGFIFPADDFIACEQFGEVPFYIKDWLPQRGKLLLYAPAKSGKSYLANQMARCIGSEEVFLTQPTVRGRVLYLQFELGESVLHDRLLSTGKGYPNVFVGTSFSIKVDTKVGQDQVIRAMEAVKPNVLILDPLYKALNGDENEASDVRKALDFLDKLIEMYNCSIVIIHHAGKDISKRGRGSSVLEDWVDSFIRVTSIPAKDNMPMRIKVLPQFLRHAPLPEEPLEFLFENYEFHPMGAMFTVKEQVGMIMRELARPVSPKEIFDAKIGSNTSVYESIKELIKEGKVTKVERGEYKWISTTPLVKVEANTKT